MQVSLRKKCDIVTLKCDIVKLRCDIVTRSDIGRCSANCEERFRNKLGQSEIAELQRFQSLANVSGIVLVSSQINNL